MIWCECLHPDRFGPHGRSTTRKRREGRGRGGYILMSGVDRFGRRGNTLWGVRPGMHLGLASRFKARRMRSRSLMRGRQ